jgi:hypothetical protein
MPIIQPVKSVGKGNKQQRAGAPMAAVRLLLADTGSHAVGGLPDQSPAGEGSSARSISGKHQEVAPDECDRDRTSVGVTAKPR